MADGISFLVDVGNWRLAGLLVAFVLVPFLLYRAALPKPIPGIPFNKDAASQIWGDAPAMQRAKRVRGWMSDQFARHNSPIIQLFMSPFQRPWVLVSDFTEAHDIMLRRNKEFDRSGLTADCFGGIMPDFQMNMKSADPRYKHNKDLVRDLMTPSFLHEVSAPELYEKMLSLIDVWEHKASVSNERPFRADLDIYMWALDITMAVAFSFPKASTMMVKQLTRLQAEPFGNTKEQPNEPVDFETIELDPELNACIYLANSVGVAFRSNMPRLAHYLYLSKAYSRKQLSIKRNLIKRNIHQSLQRLENRDTRKRLTCAVDQILLREMDRARKSGTEPEFHKDAIYDELFGFIVGGHDTTSTTFQWWVKYMSKNQQTQLRMRKELYASHSVAVAEKRLPTIQEITSTDIPYLDAMVEEAFRVSHIVPFVTREAIVDTEILGYRIPKGTQLMFATNVESFLKPAFKIDEEKRTRRPNKESIRYGIWDSDDIAEFKPERWLKRENTENGGTVTTREVFDQRAGPTLPFGAGPRGCFGRRLAYLEMRIAITTLIWKFEFLEIDGELGSLESIDTSTEAPKVCYIRLRTVN